MSSNSNTKSRPVVQLTVNKVIRVFDQGKSSGNLKFPVEKAAKLAAMVKSEATNLKAK
jgi:hypothetical protein